MTAPERSARAWPRGMFADLALIAAMLAFAVVHDLTDGARPRSGWVWVLDVGLVLPLLLRRRRPTLTFCLIAAVAFVQWVSGLLVSGDFAVLVALYSVGVYAAQRWAVAATATVAHAGVVLAVTRWAPPGRGLTGFVLSTGTVTAAWVLGVYVHTHRRYTASILDRAATAERERDQQVLLAAAGERDRISREMHDIVAHSLAVMIALSDGAGAAVATQPASARLAMAQASQLGREALGEVRRLLGTAAEHDADALAPPPGVQDLDALASQVREAGLDVQLIIVGRPLELSPAAQLTIYRMAQEALTNVLKHAGSATLAIVTLSYAADAVDIRIENDDPDRTPARSGAVGRGLAGMRERAALFSGSVKAGPRAAGGWQVAAHLRVDGQQ